MGIKFNYIFNGNQKEMEEYILQAKWSIVPIARWEDIYILYNKDIGQFQEDNYATGDESIIVCPYFLPDDISGPPFQNTLNDITEELCEINAEDEFISRLCDLLDGCELDTYSEDETENKNLNEKIELDTHTYKFYMQKKSIDIIKGEKILNFNPNEIKTFHDDLDNDLSFEEDAELEYLAEIEEEFKEWETANQKHINNCFKHKYFKFRRPINVYLAGKIKSNGWRQCIFDMRNDVMFWGDYTEQSIKNLTINYNSNINIVGPFFLSCDHSCYHGDNSHGVGTGNPWGCYGEKTFTEEQVYNICMHQIKRSDVVFAYINDDTCYGTLYEIGYARSIGKVIVLIFDSVERMSKMWFMCQGVDVVDVLKGGQTIKEKFDEIMNGVY